MNDGLKPQSPSEVLSRMKSNLGAIALSVPTDPYAYRWRELRRRQVRVQASAAVCVVVCAFGVFLLPSTITRLGLVMLAVAAAAPFVFALGSYMCPRCKKPFFDGYSKEQFNLFAKQCIHCGIAVGTSKADSGAAASEPGIRIVM